MKLNRSIIINENVVRINITAEVGESWMLLDSIVVDIDNRALYSKLRIYELEITEGDRL